MGSYTKEVLDCFLEKQGQLFDETVAENREEAEAFLDDCLAVVVSDIREVRRYLDEMGMDVEGMSDDELKEAAEVFALPNGEFLIVEG